MARFYGWNDDILENMDANTFREYLDSVSILEAQESLMQLTIADYPHQKQEVRDQIHRSLYVSAFPYRQKMSIEEALRKLGRGM